MAYYLPAPIGVHWSFDGRCIGLVRWYDFRLSIACDRYCRCGLSRLLVLLYLYSGSCFCNRTAYQLLVRYQATEPELCASLMIVSFGSPKFARSSFANWIMARMSGRYIQYVLTIY